MIAELLVLGALGYGMYAYSGTLRAITVPGETVTSRLDAAQENGYQFRDTTYTTMADYIAHPDVANNVGAILAHQTGVEDLGVFGSRRNSSQVVPGVGPLVQVSRIVTL